jgi:hypothetical protein
MMKRFILTLLFFITLFLTFCQNSEVKENYLNNLLENYKKKESKPFSKGRYLIITPAGFESTLEYFANYKRNIGFDVRVVNTNTTGKTPQAIKNFIQSQYKNSSTRPTYVLLVGDVDSLPAYEGNSTGKVKTAPITDLGYALLSGNDYFADLNLGRFSVANVEQLNNIINKTIFMEVNLHLFDKKAVFIAGDEKKGAWNKSYMTNSFKNGHEHVITNSFSPLGYTCTRLYKPDLKSVIDALNHNPLFYLYAGHGSYTLFAGKSFELSGKEINSATTNTVFPFVFSFACKTGNFAQNCIGEHFIRAKNKGAVAFFGCSVNSQTNTDKTIEKKIFGEAFKQDERYLAPMINLGMKRFATTVGPRKQIREIFLKAYNLLGDPSFDMKGVFATTSPNNQITKPALFSVFSNPLNDSFSLAYTLEKESAVQIDLCNSSGEVLKNMVQVSQQKPGCYYYNFSLTDLPSGTYELVLKDDVRTVATQVVKR